MTCRPAAWILAVVLPAPAAAADLLTETWSVFSKDDASRLGWSVASAGDVNGDGLDDVIVGEPANSALDNPGRARVYHGSANGLDTKAAWIAVGDRPDASFGFSVSSAGDVNGDGYADVVVGAPTYADGLTDEGAAFVYLGSATGIDTTPAWSLQGDQASAAYGTSVSSAGDVNADGYDDVLVGATGFSNGELFEGAAFLYLGSAIGLALLPAWVTEGNLDNAAFGVVGSAGDVNDDGFPDVLVGAPLYIGGGTAFLYLGSAAGLDTVAAWTADDGNSTAELGDSVAAAGDVNGDGLGDVIVGGPGQDRPQDSGIALVYLGTTTGLETDPVWIAGLDETRGNFGGSVVGAGDLDGDGFDDVVVGAPGFQHVYVFLGSPTGPGTSAAWEDRADDGPSEFGWSVGSAGDVNGDGSSEVIVGAWAYPAPEGGGAAFLYEVCGDACGTPSLTPADPGVAGADNTWEVTGAPAGADVIWLWASQVGQTALAGCAGVELGLAKPKPLGSSVADASGQARLTVSIPPIAAGKTMRVQAAVSDCRVTNVASTAFP